MRRNQATLGNKRAEPIEIRCSPLDETERRRTEQRLRQVQKVATVEKFAGGLLHDFNNILTVIVGHSQLLLEQPEIGVSARRRVQQILNAGFRAASLTSQLLAFSRKQLPQPTAINLNQVIEDSIKMIRFLVGDDIEVRTLLAADLQHVNADPGQMEHVIVNFCTNARDAMPEGGRILIETQTVEVHAGSAEKHFAMRPGRYVRLAVSDTGIGMDQQTLGQIFGPFFTTKGPEEGAGLGLAIVHCIVKQSNGYVWAESKLGEGSTFFVYLPAASEEVEMQNPEAKPLEIVRGSETILVVENAAPLRVLIRELLEGLGYNVLEAEDVDRAHQLAEQHKSIAALLADYSLPGTSSLTLPESLRKTLPELKVLQMTAPPSGFVNHGFPEPGTDFLPKPFTAEALGQKLHKLLNKT